MYISSNRQRETGREKERERERERNEAMPNDVVCRLSRAYLFVDVCVSCVMSRSE